MKTLPVLFAMVLTEFVFSLTQAQRDTTRIAQIGDIRYADRYPGIDGGAQIAAALSDLGGPGIVDARGFSGPQTISSTVSIGVGQIVHLGPNIWTSSASNAMFSIVGSARDTIAAGSLYQDPGGILEYTGTGAAILLSPGAFGDYINGATIDVDTINCNGFSPYGIQFGGVGWVQRANVTFKHIWRCARAGVDFQGGRKNGSFIRGDDLDGSNVAGTAELGTYGVLFEDPTILQSSGYNLYEGDHIEISSIRNTASYALVVDFRCSHNYFVVDTGNDYSHTTVPFDLHGSANTVILTGANPWADYNANASVGGSQAWYPSVFFDSNSEGGNTVILPPYFAAGIIDANLLGFSQNISVPSGDDNFLLNGSFEDIDGTYPTGWNLSNVTVAGIGNQAKSGRLSGQMKVAAATAGYIYQALPSWIAGQTVIACAWIKNGNTGSSSGLQAISLYDNVGIKGESENFTIKPSVTPNWYYLCASKAFPAGATTLQLRLYADKSGTNTGGQNVLVDGAGVYFGVQPFMPSTAQSGAIGTTLLAGTLSWGGGRPIDSSTSVLQTIARGTSTLGNKSIAAGACATLVTTFAAGAASTDAIEWSFNSAPAAADGLLSYTWYLTTNEVNWEVCNPTSSLRTPSGLNINWRVVR